MGIAYDCVLATNLNRVVVSRGKPLVKSRRRVVSTIHTRHSVLPVVSLDTFSPLSGRQTFSEPEQVSYAHDPAVRDAREGLTD